MILYHQHDGALVNSQIIFVYPKRKAWLRLRRLGDFGECFIVTIKKTIFTHGPAIPHCLECRQANFRRKRHGTYGCGRGNGTVIFLIINGCAACAISRAEYFFTLMKHVIVGSVSGCKTPDIWPVTLEFARVFNAVLPLSERCAAGVFKIIKASFLHVWILNAPEINPAMAVLMAEQRTEVHMVLAFIFGAEIRFAPFFPNFDRYRMRW